MGFGFVKVMQLTNREGLNCKVEGGDECPSLGHLGGHGREREKEIFVGDILVEVMEVCGSVWK